jgi:hypothetical protein
MNSISEHFIVQDNSLLSFNSRPCTNILVCKTLFCSSYYDFISRETFFPFEYL